jgi:hypothetical protein
VLTITGTASHDRRQTQSSERVTARAARTRRSSNAGRIARAALPVDSLPGGLPATRIDASSIVPHTQAELLEISALYS